MSAPATVPRRVLAAVARTMCLLALPGLAVMAAGCTTVVPVVPPMLACKIEKEQLSQRCAEPGSIGDDVTCSQLVGVAITDRKSLKLCAEHQRKLAEAVVVCNDTIAEHNKKLDAINEQLSKRP